MKNRRAALKRCLTVAGTAAILIAAGFSASPAAADSNAPINFTPQVSIPNSQFTAGNATPAGTSNNGVITSDLLANYINAFYKYGLSIAGILAVLVLMAAGVIWITSAGDANKVSQAKKMIAGSLGGLVILVCAWVILNTVNPSLVSLQTFDLVQIQKTSIEKTDSTGGTPCCYSNTELGTYKDGICSRSQACPSNTQCKGDGTKFLCVSDTGSTCCEYKTSLGPNIKKCMPIKTGSCPKTSDGQNLIASYANFYCNNTNITSGHCNDKNQNCSGKSLGFACYDAKSENSGFCYNNTCLTTTGASGDPCGTQTGAKCLSGITGCPDGYTHDTGGRSCTTRYWCCYPNGK